MHSNRRWILTGVGIALGALAGPGMLQAQTVYVQTPRHFRPPLGDEARDIFNSGQRLYDQDNFVAAEKRFREVIQKFPTHIIAARAEYYLIRVLTQLGKRAEALARINSFGKMYPRSRWSTDVEELRIRLTNQVPPAAERVLLLAPPAAPAPPSPPAPPARGILIGQRNVVETQDSEITLQQEIMRAIFLSDAQRAMVIATERLKSNMADPLVVSSLNMLATSASSQALPMLLEIAKNSPSPKARKDAIFWMTQTKADKDAIADALTGLMSSNADDWDAVTFAFGQLRTEKAVNALATIAQDKSRLEAARQSAVFWLRNMRMPEANQALENLLRKK
jgi:tetratricopeptide (TPR) repeat protein